MRSNLYNTLSSIRDRQDLPEIADEVLNPFDSKGELDQFSDEINHGEHLRIWLNSFGNGTSVQLNLIRQFLAQHFNSLDFLQAFDANETGVLPISTLDYRLPFASASQSSPIETIFSATYLKVLNGTKISESERASLREATLTEEELGIPTMVGCVNPDTLACHLSDFNGSFNYLLAERTRLRKYFFSGKDQGMTEKSVEEVLNIPPLSLRFLYAMGDFAVVSENHNTMEPVHLEVPTVTIPSQQAENPNISINRALSELKALLPISGFIRKGFDWRPKNTVRNRGFYDHVYASVQRDARPWEMSPRESMEKLLQLFEKELAY